MFEAFASVSTLSDFDAVSLGNRHRSGGTTVAHGVSVALHGSLIVRGFVVACCLWLSLVPLNIVTLSEHGQILVQTR